MIKRSVLLLGLLLCSPSMALQIKPAPDNGTVTVNLSSGDITRLVVQGDRIQQLVGVKGSYHREHDEVHGTVYIQPTLAYQHRAFTLFIETEGGWHFTVLFNPLQVPADTVLFVRQPSRGRNDR